MHPLGRFATIGVKMRRLHWLLVFLIVFGHSTNSRAQAWAGIIDPSRAIDWSSPGIPGPVPTRTTICATLNPGASSSNINAALAACPAGQVVFLNAGTYTISSGINFGARNNVTLRGAGPSATIINFNGGDGCYGQGGDVCMANSTGFWEGNAATQPGGGNAADWTAGYARGTTQITLSSTSGLTVGSVLILDQANDASDTGGTFVNDDMTYSQQGGAPGRNINGVDYDQQQFVTVAAISGNSVSISPGLYMNNWRASQSPKAWWTGPALVGAGIENLTVNHNGTGSAVKSGIYMYNCYQCYIKNVRSLNANRNHVWMYLTSRSVVRDSYFYGTQHAASQSYGVEFFEASNNLVENNIFDNVVTSIMPGNTQGNVVAYNYGVHDAYANPPSWLETAYVSHDAGTAMNLFEGNQFNGLFCDDIHGTSNVGTLFRNQLYGVQAGKTLQTNPIMFASYCRSNNIIGNVLGTVGYHNTYEASPQVGAAGCFTSIYDLGFGNVQCSGGSPANDNLVKTTLLRWGNYDTVTGTVRWVASEIPTSGVPFINGNPVPSTHTLPSSFYLTSKPVFWGSMPWPPIGPDVTGGTGPGGLAYANPAQTCYNNTAGDSNFSGTTVIAFDANTCYSGKAPAPPTNLKITVQ